MWLRGRACPVVLARVPAPAPGWCRPVVWRRSVRGGAGLPAPGGPVCTDAGSPRTPPGGLPRVRRPDVRRRARPGFQEGLLRYLQPPVPRRGELVSERVAPTLADIGDAMAGRGADEVLAALDAAIREAGGTPDAAALREFAVRIEGGENPFG